MTVVLGAVAVATGFCLGILVGMEVTDVLYRRRRHRYSRRRRELAQEEALVRAARDDLAHERAEMARRRCGPGEIRGRDDRRGPGRG